MKTLTKLALLMALVIGGKLSKSSEATVATQAPKPTGEEMVMVNQREDFRPMPADSQQSQPAQAQVISVFFK